VGEWQTLAQQLADSPAATLPELDVLVGGMLEARGLTIHDPAAAGSAERESLPSPLPRVRRRRCSTRARRTSRPAISPRRSTATGASSNA
jgi:hypothetical protein